MIGGALNFGATILNPQPSMKDLMKELADIKKSLAELPQSEAATRALRKEERELEEAIQNPDGELNSNFIEVIAEMSAAFDVVSKTNAEDSEDISYIRDTIQQTFLQVVDTRYKVTALMYDDRYTFLGRY